MTTTNEQRLLDLTEIIGIGNVVLVSAEALIPPSGLGIVHRINTNYLVLDPLPSEDTQLEEGYNLMPVLFRTVVALDTIKLIVKIREEPIKPQEKNDSDEEESSRN